MEKEYKPQEHGMITLGVQTRDAEFWKPANRFYLHTAGRV
jgi:hypothetical protein